MPDSSSSAKSATSGNPQESSPSVMTSKSKVRIDLGDITPHNIKLLRKVNQVVFPVVYHDHFYKDVLEAGELAKLAYCNDIVVGAVCCRIDTSDNTRKLYIMTLGCLAPYRRLGIGTKMVEHVLNVVEKDGNFDSVFLHVQVRRQLRNISKNISSIIKLRVQ